MAKSFMTKKMKLGFLLQAEGAHTNVSGNPTGTGVVGNHRWDNGVNNNPADEIFFGILGIKGTINPDPQVEQYQLNSIGSNSAFLEEARAKLNKDAVLPTVDFEAYATPIVVQALLMGALQNANTYPGSPDIQVLQIRPEDEEIDFTIDNSHTSSDSASTGLLYSIAGIGCDSGTGGKTDGFVLTNAVVNTLSITFENTADGEARLGKVKAQFVGTKLYEDVDFTNPFSDPESYVFNESGLTENDFFNLTLSVGGTSYPDVCWKKYEFSVNNNITSDCFTFDGAADLKRVNPEITATIDIPHNDITCGTFEQYQEGGLVSATIANGYTAASEQNALSIGFTKGQMTSNPRTTDGDYVAQQIQVNVLKPTSGGWGDMVTTNNGNATVDWDDISE